MRVVILLAVLAALVGLATGPGCSQAPAPAPLTQVVALQTSSVPEGPADPAWELAPEFVAKLLLQDLVEPRQMETTTVQVRVRALFDGTRLAFRLQWADATQSDVPGPARFCDACAVQLPARIEPTLPAPQMGEPGRPVEITYWNAGWQAAADGRGDSIRDLYPNAAIDHYPFQAPALEKGSPAQEAMALRYSPARAVGNEVAGPHTQPVQDLLAEGPGTLWPAPASLSAGRGVHSAEGWAVVLVRRLPQGLSPDLGTQVAFAVWEGGHEEVGARKMRTGWIPLVFQQAP